MTVNFVSLTFIWLLSLTTSSTVTPGENHNSTNMMAAEVGNKSTHDQLTTQEEKTTKPSSKSSLQTTRTMPKTFLMPNTQTAATPPNPSSSPLKGSTEGMKSTTEVQFKVTTSAARGVTSQARNSTTRVPVMLSSSTISQDTRKTSTSHLISDDMMHPSTRLTQSTTTSTKTVENESTSTSPVTGGETTQSTGLYKIPVATTKAPFIHITKAKTRQDPRGKKPMSKKGTNHSIAVAGLIGGALGLMMVGFLVIYIKKRKLQRQQITTRDWAGPSPFLEGGADNGQVTLGSSNRISLSSFLPQRLSKRLSLLPETDEELEDMTPGTTFGDKHQGSTFGGEVDGNDVQERHGTVVVPEKKSTGDAPENVENSVTVSSAQSNDPLSTNNNSGVPNLSEDHPANPPTLSGEAKTATDNIGN